MDGYVRMLAIDEGAEPDWEAVLRELKRDPDLDDPAKTLAELQELFAHPEAWGVRCFPFKGARVYLAVGDDWGNADGGGLDLIRSVQDSGVFDAVGAEMVATRVYDSDPT
jgi:hypothetical protein